MKKLIIAAAVVVAGAFGIFQANNNNAQMSELQLENAELLAQGEDNCPKVEYKYPGNPSNGTKYVCFGSGSVDCC